MNQKKWLFSVLMVFVLILPQNMVFANEKVKAGEVEIIRDEYGVPHIYADNKQDLYSAYGYVMANYSNWKCLGEGMKGRLLKF